MTRTDSQDTTGNISQNMTTILSGLPEEMTGYFEAIAQKSSCI